MLCCCFATSRPTQYGTLLILQVGTFVDLIHMLYGSSYRRQYHTYQAKKTTVEHVSSTSMNLHETD